MSATDFGLPTGLTVATGIVDGYGGTLAVLLAGQKEELAGHTNHIEQRLSMIVGTSSIYTSTSKTSKNIPGTWGPMPSVLDGYFHNIVGQTAAGALIDHITHSHPAYQSACYNAQKSNLTFYQYLNNILNKLADKKDTSISELSGHIHVLPYFAGNRTPWKDMALTGVITGCTLAKSEVNLALIYLATIQALALEAKQNLLTLSNAGYLLKLLMPAGGLSRNEIYMQEHVNTMGLAAALPESADPMLIAGAITAAVTSKSYDSIEKAMSAMSHYKEIIPIKLSNPVMSMTSWAERQGEVTRHSGSYGEELQRRIFVQIVSAIGDFESAIGIINPCYDLLPFYNRKYTVFQEIHQDQIKHRKMMIPSEWV